ncbi:hypothetical protein Q7P37_005686 [Cladosporium fusiforme]
MKVSTLSLALCPLAAIAYPDAALHARDNQSESFHTDLFEGTRLQEDDSSLNASDLTYTQQNGRPWYQPLGAQRVGRNGPLLLQDAHLLDTMATFNRERIPERVVHARGAGAHGYFEVTSDFAARHSVADVFKPGTRTSISMRFSTVGGARGSADTARDPRGFSIKMRTKKGILDWVFNNTPVFFIRDPLYFPRFIHTQKTDPATNARDWNTFWAWPAQFPESMLQFLRLLSDLGTPYGFRHMHGWSGHTYKLVQDDGSFVYTRVKLESEQGVRNFTDAEAKKHAGENDAWATKDLFDAIEKGDYPAWKVSMATMTEEEAADYRYDILDLTKDWLNVTYHDVGRMVLTQNPENYHAEIEQAHFSPANMVDGWEPSNDPVLQSRLFAYNDAARHRIGVNYQQIPVNCPMSPVANFDRDGHLSVRGNQGSRQNFPDQYRDPLKTVKKPGAITEPKIEGNLTYYQSEIEGDIDFEQPRQFYQVQLSEQDRKNLHDNIAGTLVNVDNDDIREALFEQFAKVDAALERGVREAYKEALAAES